MERVFKNQSGLAKHQQPPVYIENKQFFYDLAFVPAQKEINQVDKETINESVYGKNWRQKVANSVLQSKVNIESLGLRKITSTNQAQTDTLSNANISQYKKKKNLNEVSSLYISSDDEDEDRSLFNEFTNKNNSIYEDEKSQNKNQTINTQGNRSLMSHYSNKKSNLRLNNTSRFKLLTPKYTGMRVNERGESIQHQEFVVDNEYSENNQMDMKFQVKPLKKFNYSQRISEQAMFDYYRNFKNLKASVERDEHLIFPQSAYINSCEKSNLIPRPYGLVSYKGDDEELNVKNFLMGNKYAKAYSSGLQLLKTKKINVSNNRLDEKGTMSVLKGLNKSAVEDIDLSSNKMGQGCVQYLGDLILKGQENFNLRILKLEQTQITDTSLLILIDSLDQASDNNKSYIQELNLACNMITCTGAEKIAQYLTKNPVSLKVLNLHWNKIKIKGGIKIADSLQHNSNLKVLDLSWNALGKTNVTFAGQMSISEVKKKLKGQGTIQNQEDAIQQISEMEKQDIEIQVGKAWGKALRHNKYLLHLDLSYNCFGVDTCRVMQKKIKKNHTLFGLHLAGNACTVDTHGFIQIEGDEQIVKVIGDKKSTANKNNTTSRQQKQRNKNSIADMIINSPQKEVLFTRMEGLKAVIKKRNQSFGQSPNRTNMSQISAFQSSPNGKNKNEQTILDTNSTIMNQASVTQPGAALQKYKVKDNCWICEGWSEFKIELRVPQFIGAEVYLHFDFDDYKPDLMVSSSAGVYQCFRMVPPGTHHYFMSVNGSEYFTSGPQIVPIDEHTIKSIDDKLTKNFKANYNKTFNMQKLNYVESMFQSDHLTITTVLNQNKSQMRHGSPMPRTPVNLDTNTSLNKRNVGLSNSKNSASGTQPHVLNNPETYAISRIKNCIPRPDKKFLTQKQDRPRTPWTFPISLFKEYKPETPALITECFEFDWSCLKKPKMKKSTEEELKEKCREMYPFIREINKRLAALGIVGTVFSIGWNVYREFMIQTLNISDKEKLKPDDCDRLFIGVNAGNLRKAPFIPEKALVRFQFLEILIKSGLKRYFESGDVENEVDAIGQLIINNLNPLQESSDISYPYNYNQHRWREERYWNEACDNIYKAFAPLFTNIYNTFGGSHKKPGQKTFMTLDEFDYLIQAAGLINDMMNQRDIAVHFNFSMMCQVNEIDYERHLCATYIEFLEAFARVCDQASIVIYQPQNKLGASLDVDNLDGGLNNGQSDFMLTEEDRQSMPLHVKIESAIQYLLKNCCKQKGFLDKFEMPKKHPQVGLYILPTKKFF